MLPPGWIILIGRDSSALWEKRHPGLYKLNYKAGDEIPNRRRNHGNADRRRGTYRLQGAAV